MTWLLSVLIVIVAIGGFIFIPYWISILVFGREKGEEAVQWIFGAGIIIAAAIVIIFIVIFVIGIHNKLF